MDEKALDRYTERFAGLRTDKSRSRWPVETMHRAPHKPLLLLCVLDLFERGEAGGNLIRLTPDLGELFLRYWTKISPFNGRGNLALPFFHLRGDGFWHLLPKPGKEDVLDSASQIRSLSKLEETILGARLDDELFVLLQASEPRNFFRAVLTSTYFAPRLRDSLVEQGDVNREAFSYGERLLGRMPDQTVGDAPAAEAYRPAVRDQGFRRAVTIAYAHRCALCSVRVRTLDGHTVVDAAHIVPWSVSQDDRPANGMALCRTCHWAFDEGLLRVSRRYEIFTSVQLRVANNLPGYLSNLEGRAIIGPEERDYWPDPHSLQWHLDHVFRTA